MHNNHFVAQKLHGFFSSAFKKIIRNSTTPTFQEKGGVIRPLYFDDDIITSHGIA